LYKVTQVKVDEEISLFVFFSVSYFCRLQQNNDMNYGRGKIEREKRDGRRQVRERMDDILLQLA